MDTTSETCFMSFFPLLSSKGFPVHREEPLKKKMETLKSTGLLSSVTLLPYCHWGQ